MKKLIFLLFIQFTLITANAQVKIGATGNPDVNAVLELAGTAKGLLLPRLSLTGTSSPAPLSAFTAGMVVYNTANVSDMRPGYYYSDGSKWIRIFSSSDAWSLSGNSGTNPNSQFIGTVDSVGLAIRTDNTDRIKISPNGSIGVGTGPFSDVLKVSIGVTASERLAVILGLNGTIRGSTNGSQVLYSFFNSPSFEPSFTPTGIYGALNDLSYSGQVAGSVIADAGRVSTNGSNNYPGKVIGVYGSVQRGSTGNGDAGFYGGWFEARVLGSGTVNEIYSIGAEATIPNIQGWNPNVGILGGIKNNVIFDHDNSTVTDLIGIKNEISHQAPTLVGDTYCFYNRLNVASGSQIGDAYGTYTILGSSGSITNAFGCYLTHGAGADINNYTGIYVADISLPSGTRRAFEYAGAGSNDPVIINYDGSVQIGTLSPVTNAKLSIVNGHVQSGQSTKPTISSFPPIGTGGSASLIDATDVAGIISLNIGTANWFPGTVAIINFNKTYANPPIVIITAANSAAAAGMENQRPFVSASAGGFTINFGAPATNGNLMLFNYMVIETVNN